MPQCYQSGITHKCLVIFYHHERNYSHPRPDIKKYRLITQKKPIFQKWNFFSPLDDIKKNFAKLIYMWRKWCEVFLWLFFPFFLVNGNISLNQINESNQMKQIQILILNSLKLFRLQLRELNGNNFSYPVE